MAKKAHSISAKIPQNRQAAELDMRKLGDLRIRVAEIDNALKQDSQKLIQAAKDKAEPLQAQAQALEDALMLYASAHRAELTDGNKSKRGKMLSGHFDWRKLPDSVSLRGIPAIIVRVKEAIFEAKDEAYDLTAADPEKSKELAANAVKMESFLRIKTEINKDAMLAAPALAKSIKGVSIKSPGERLEIHVYENSLKD